MATAAMSAAGTGTPTPKGNRGKDQIQWSPEVWKGLDEAVTDEMMRTRVAAKFLPQVYVEKKRTTVESDVVLLPAPPQPNQPYDPALWVEESQTTRIQEYYTTFRLSVAQVEAEEHQETPPNGSVTPPSSPTSAAQGGSSNGAAVMSRPHRAGTAISLALRTANPLALAEDCVIYSGQNAVANSALFSQAQPQVQCLDPSLQTDLDFGLANIQPLAAGSTAVTGLPAGTPANVIMLPASSSGKVVQVVPVHPSVNSVGQPPQYREQTLAGVAEAFSILQSLGHYENYALTLHTYPYADLHQALPTTLVEPVEPVSHLVKAGIYGTGALPPFTTPTPANPLAYKSGLPTMVLTSPPGQTPLVASALSVIPGFNTAEGATPNVLYTGVLVSLSGNTMDLVRGILDDSLDAQVTFNQKDQNEQYRFRVFERFALRLKDPTAVILLLFLDS
jgi:hypothetical protein